MKTIEEFISKIQSGVDWGRPPIMRWQSKDKRYAICTCPGHAAWHGRGSTKYAPVQHWAIDLRKWKSNMSGLTLWRNCLLGEIEGRMTKSMLEDLIALTRRNHGT